MTTILLNDDIISTVAQRGIARYFSKIVDSAIAHFGREAIICSPQERNYGAARHIPTVRFPGSWRIGLQDKIASIVTHVARPSVVYNVYYGNVETKTPQVFTVYDMMHEMFAPPSHPFIAQKRRCFQRAWVLLAISENTAKDIVAIYPKLEAKVVVTQLGVDEFFFKDNAPTCANLKRPYFLYVGHRTPYKNFIRLLTAFGKSGLSQQFDLRVISPMGGQYSQQELDCMRKYQLQGHIHMLMSPSDEILRDSYRQAYAFVYPSTYEGFGLPILEAMASGTLVASANTSSMPEIGGDVALYFDPLSVESIAECLQQMAGLPSEERARRIARGLARAQIFTWERCQRQTMDVLRGLATCD